MVLSFYLTGKVVNRMIQMKHRLIPFFLSLLLFFGTACTQQLPPSTLETAASVASTEAATASTPTVSPATNSTESVSETETFPVTDSGSETTSIPETEPAPETESVPETASAPEKPEVEGYFDINDVGKLRIHIQGPADNRPAYPYSFNPYAYSSIYTLAYGPSVGEEIRGFCDAVLAGEDSFPCTGFDNWLHIDQIKNYLLPFSTYLTVYDPSIESGLLYEESRLQDGRYPIFYQVPKEEFLSIVEQFKVRVAELIAQADLREGDSDLEKALKLYTATSVRIAYDYSGVGPNTVYRALMGDYGICQEIGPAYAYLLLQVGVDAGVCGGVAKDDSFAHEWTLIKLNGKWYHADATWQLSDPYSLRYFLNDDNDRSESNLNVPNFNIGELNELWHSDLPMEDDSFAELWNARWYTINHKAGYIEYYDDPDLNYYDLSVYQNARKTFPLR